ncbi:MAG TPA: hypothetical protein VF902_04730 [Coriobacteriia bacterium]
MAALLLASTTTAGCSLIGGAGSTPAGTGSTPAGTGTVATGGTGTAGTAAATGQALAGDIPPGREIAEGGGGPKQYTFREEWRRGLAKATAWRSGAYLITAVGDMINNEGVPSSWTMWFIDKPADTVLIVEMDPWGAVTRTREVTGDGVKSFVTEFTKPIPVDVIDSDKAVSLGSEALAAAYDLNKTKEPRAALNFSRVDGSGPHWNYTVFNNSTAEYVTAQVDALTGTAKLTK